VSTLDFPNGILLQGFRIPALATRRAETEVELRDGQSFAVAGLLNNLSQDDANEIPGLARLPIIGHLFKSKSERAEQTELLVLITPQLVRPLNPDEVPPLPTLERRFLPRGGGIGGRPPGRRRRRRTRFDQPTVRYTVVTKHPHVVAPLRERWKSERGVSLIMVAVEILMLTGFTVFVLDYGVMWLGRRQAQNAADAAALAGAISRATTNRWIRRRLLVLSTKPRLRLRT
jgi:hypothetical protein